MYAAGASESKTYESDVNRGPLLPQPIQRREQKDQRNQTEEQVLADEWVTHLITDNDKREEQMRQDHIAQIAQKDEQMAQDMFWDQQNAEQLRWEHTAWIAQEAQDTAQAREEAEQLLKTKAYSPNHLGAQGELT